ncbi:MAG: alpha/beta fold hydrolase [Streptosporangiaceae bacterium]
MRVIRYDARGYGRSPQPTGPFRPLDDLTAVLDQLEVPAAHLVGCSAGGANAIDLALAHRAATRSSARSCARPCGPGPPRRSSPGKRTPRSAAWLASPRRPC